MVEWKSVPLGTEGLAEFDSENLSANTDPEYRFEYITLENVVSGTLIATIPCVFKGSSPRARRIVHKNDILLGTVRPNLHSHYYIGNDTKDLICSTGFCVITPNENLLHGEFLFQLLFSQEIDTQIEKIITGSNYPAISSTQIKELEIPLPPLAEQRTIAAALADADSYIAALKRLIAKKRNIKQGAMQELLRPKDEWIEKPIGELFAISGGRSASRAQLSDSGYFYLHYGDIHASKKAYIDTDEDKAVIPRLNVPLSKLSSDSLLQDGDVVFVDASEDDIGASRHVVIRNQSAVPFIAGLHTIVAKPLSDETDRLFREYCFQTVDVIRQFIHYAVGTKVTGVSKTTIKKINITYPKSTTEQHSIAQILSDMDAEINALTAKLNKAKLIKQGMMEQLLTGKIRLEAETNA